MQIKCMAIACLLLCFNQAMAQYPGVGERGIIYMHDGSVFIGEITERTRQKISIKAYKDQVVEIAVAHTKKILDAQKAIVFPNGKYHKTHGFFWGFSYGFNARGLVTELDNRVSNHLETYFGWHITPRFSLSYGLGFEFNETRLAGFNIDTRFTSNYIMGRYFLTDTKARLFTYSRVGYGSAADNEVWEEHTGGFQLQLGGGVVLPSRRKRKFVFSSGLHLQKTSGTESFLDFFGNEVDLSYDLLFRRVMIKIGMEF